MFNLSSHRIVLWGAFVFQVFCFFVFENLVFVLVQTPRMNSTIFFFLVLFQKVGNRTSQDYSFDGVLSLSAFPSSTNHQ